jgi:hypothetical protein
LEHNGIFRLGRFATRSHVPLVLLLLSSACFGQLPSSRCDSSNVILEDCVSLVWLEPIKNGVSTSQWTVDGNAALPERSEETPESAPSSEAVTIASAPPAKQSFQWRRALSESFTFLAIEQAYVVHSDFSWVVVENGIPFNHYWRDYKQSLTTWAHSGWNDGDPNWFGYVGHPIQGALTGFIQIQNDPQGEKLEFSKTKAYWWSRTKAAMWNAAYSTQWNLGPLSEVTVEKYGTKTRAPWNYDGSYPCTKHCLTGVGQIDIVMTPLAGTGWLIGEDFLDKEIVRRVENATDNHILIDTVRCALNPIRGGAYILHGKPPWYRASRDVQKTTFIGTKQPAEAARETPATQIPNHGDVFWGYSHTGSVHCQNPIVDTTTTCNPFSTQASNLNGWNASVEKRYLRYFGAVANFGGEYGGVTQRNYLFGIRGSATIGRFRPFAEALLGAVTLQDSGFAAPKSDTSFAEALGIGIDFRLMRLLSWRIQADQLKTELTAVGQQRVLVSSGLAIRF